MNTLNQELSPAPVVCQLDPGVPYDWANPDSYIAPRWTLIECDPTDFTAVHEVVKNKNYQTALNIGVSVVSASFLTISAYALLLNEQPGKPKHNALVASVAQNPQTPECPKNTSALAHLPSVEQSRQAVARMEFGISEAQYNVIQSRIDEAKSLEQIEQTLNDVFGAYRMHVSIGTLPQKEAAPTKTAAASLSHQPEQITLNGAKESTKYLLWGLSKIPAPLLSKVSSMDIYLTAGIKSSWQDVGGLFLSHTQEGNSAIIVDIAEGLAVEGIFEHEFMHALHYSMCGDNIANDDEEFANLNPASFNYTQDSAKQNNAFDQHITVSPYAATNTIEDVAETGKSLFDRGLSESNFLTCDKDPSVECTKADLLVEREASVDPTVVAYYVYKAGVGNVIFPANTAMLNYG